MVVKKFYGATTRDALRQVRDELGPDALILSNRQVAGGGVEIMAVADSDVAALTSAQTIAASRPSARIDPPAPPARPAPSTPPLTRALERSYAIPDEDDDTPVPAPAPQVVRSNRAPRIDPSLVEPRPVRERQPVPERQPFAEPPPVRATAPDIPAPPAFRYSDDDVPAAPAIAPTVQPAAIDDIAREMRQLRGLMEHQLAGMAWSELSRQSPDKLDALRQLLAAGFCPALARQLVDKMPAQMAPELRARWLKAALVHNIAAVGDGDDLIAQGGVYALIGPTGVGKTTTVAKLAARCALAYGPESVALLTTDSYRIGATDQLRIYGRILGVPVHEVKDDTDFELTLADLASRHLVLIDTVGMGQRDLRIVEQLRLFQHERAHTLLLLAANAAPATLDDVARRYKNEQLAGVILTKLDETMSLGGCLDVAIRHRLKLHFVTNGQRVPEDLHPARTEYLVDRAFRAEPGRPFQLQPDEYPVFMGAQAASTEDAGFGEPTPRG
ncbi:flagellar biosynthesis protein FlhF [Jeongeupia chitinilytica]|uniref:Flagellar biosynthesis protein FlhF n=1 Tax=Jeongeupia chitinilytica TaxID=1041641 RepID=A0ABQ3GUX8_9NEIS|nr:flagellar biosynthesis protein FlhF [Jeongeupia chitinilytica]GHD55449.1 flagellar biosynthesis regulator FlhF [Jeongeupia chitinilytica]